MSLCGNGKCFLGGLFLAFVEQLSAVRALVVSVLTCCFAGCVNLGNQVAVVVSLCGNGKCFLGGFFLAFVEQLSAIRALVVSVLPCCFAGCINLCNQIAVVVSLCGDGECFLGGFCLVLIKQYITYRALVMSIRSGCLAGCINLGDQIAGLVTLCGNYRLGHRKALAESAPLTCGQSRFGAGRFHGSNIFFVMHVCGEINGFHRNGRPAYPIGKILLQSETVAGSGGQLNATCSFVMLRGFERQHGNRSGAVVRGGSIEIRDSIQRIADSYFHSALILLIDSQIAERAGGVTDI